MLIYQRVYSLHVVSGFLKCFFKCLSQLSSKHAISEAVILVVVLVPAFLMPCPAMPWPQVDHIIRGKKIGRDVDLANLAAWHHAVAETCGDGGIQT